MSGLFLRNGEIKSVEDNDDEEEDKEGNDCDQRLTKDIDPSEFVVDGEWLAVVFDSVFFHEVDHGSSDGVQISEMKSIGKLSNRIRLYNLDITERRKSIWETHKSNLLGSFWKNDLDLCLLNNHISGQRMNQWDFQTISSISLEQEFSGRHVVPKNVVGFPSSEQWESRTHFNFNTILVSTNYGSRNVSDLVTVVDIMGSIRKDGLEGFNNRRLGSSVDLVIQTGERSLQSCSLVYDFNSVFNGDISPMRDFDDTLQRGDDSERRVVFVMDSQGSHGERLDVGSRSNLNFSRGIFASRVGKKLATAVFDISGVLIDGVRGDIVDSSGVKYESERTLLIVRLYISKLCNE